MELKGIGEDGDGVGEEDGEIILDGIERIQSLQLKIYKKLEIILDGIERSPEEETDSLSWLDDNPWWNWKYLKSQKQE